MPIYDYRCGACHKRFAVFFRSFAEVGAVTCQHCGSDEVARLAPRVARLVGEDARLDRLSDPSALGDVDENDPGSVARWAKRLGREMGEDLGDEFDEAMDEMAAGGMSDEPDPTPYKADSSSPPSRATPLDRPLIVAAVSGGIAFALYLATAASDIVVGDPTEFAIVSLTGGIAHPPGYPLLTLLGRAFAALPLDPAPFRVNLVSVVAGAASIALVATTARRLGAPGLAATVGALVFATSPVVWRWSVVAEAFPLNDLLVGAIVLALVIWRARPGAVAPLAAAGLLGGLALTNHQTAALIAPGVVVALWQERDALRARPILLVAGLGALLLGLAPYAYVPLASAMDPVWHWGRVSSLGDLWTLVSRQTYGSTQLVTEVALRGGSASTRLAMLLSTYWPLEGLLVLVGAAAAFTRHRWYLWRTLAALAIAGPVFVAYADIDPARSVNAVVLERFFLLSHVLTAPLIVLGIGAIADYARAKTRWRHAAPAALAAMLVATAAIALPTYQQADRREDHVARFYGLDILASVEDGTVLLTAGDDTSTAVAYLRIVEGARPNVTHVLQSLLRTDWYVATLRARHPDLVIPFERLGGPSTLRTLVEANLAHTFAVAGGLIDDSLKDTHWLSTRGLVSIIKPLPASGTVDELARENDRLLASYHPPSTDQVRGRQWEQAIRGDYARPAFLIGQQYELTKQYAEARTWYSRSLAIDPQMQRAREALARLPRT